MKNNKTIFLSQFCINAQNKLWAYLFILLFVSCSFSLLNFKDLNLNAGLPTTMFFIDYEDRARKTSWLEIAEEEEDPFIKQIAENKKNFRISWGLHSFTHLPAHFFFKVFKLKGKNLWFAMKIFHIFMGLSVAVLVFLIANLFYDPEVALVSGFLTSFSPHVWTLYNMSADPSKPYNVLFGLLTIYTFFLFLENKKKIYSYICGLIMGINFLFFHAGSFMFPIVIFLICVFKSLNEKSFRHVKNYFMIVVIALITSALLNKLHAVYFDLPFNPFLKYIQDYLAFGPAASHTIHGLVFLDLEKFFSNAGNHFQGVFLNGTTEDWHYQSSLPSVPMVYNFFVAILFLYTCVNYVRIHRQREFIFFLWFFAYFFIYSFLIFVRQKNIHGELPPIFILAARGVTPFAVSMYKKLYGLPLKNFIKRKSIQLQIWIMSNKLFRYTPLESFPEPEIPKCFSVKMAAYGVGVFLVFTSIGISAQNIMNYFPNKGWFGAYRSYYPLYQVISEKGYTSKTWILNSGLDANVDLLLRLYTGKNAKIRSWNRYGINGTILRHYEGPFAAQSKDKWKSMELDIKKNSDKIFFLFTEDSVVQKLFEQIHPDLSSTTITNPRGDVIWTIYEVSGLV